MDFVVRYPGFEGRGLVLREGLLSGASLWVDGARVKREKGIYVLRDNQGRSVEVKLKPTLLDPIPNVQIGDEKIRLAEPLKAYEYIWAALPLGLIFVGGAIGGGLGGAAAYFNLRLSRTEYPYAVKYAITAAVTVAAFVTFLILAALIAIVIGRK